MKPPALPPRLRDVPFTIDEAQRAGVSLSRVRASDLDRSVWGVRSALPATTLAVRSRLFAHRLPDVVLSHTTAAQLHGIPVPLAWAKDERVHVCVEPPRRAPHAQGLIGHRLPAVEGDIIDLHGSAATSAVRTWIDLGSILSLTALVAAGDFVIHHRLPLATVDQLRERLRMQGSARGTRRLRQAIDLLSDRAESPPESELRVILALGGLPAPVINHVLVDTETGSHVRPDFLFRNQRVILEYQGDYHRTKQQWRRDMTRRTRLEVRDWYVMELNADDLKDPAELVVRIRAVLARRG